MDYCAIGTDVIIIVNVAVGPVESVCELHFSIRPCQEPITRSLHPDSTFARIFLFLEPSQVSISREIGLCSPAFALETKKKMAAKAKGSPSDEGLLCFLNS